jgi:serine phosphatase RsbU (regulator of sigma subunit)/CHASE2 domain-containing sensor protein
MTPLERRIFIRSLLVASIVTLAVLVADWLGLLATPENWLSDLRSAYCQVFSPKPSDKIVFLDIDDGSIDALGRWPWSRATIGRMLAELAAAKPKAVGLDVVFSEAETQVGGIAVAGKTGDQELAAAIRAQPVVTALDFLLPEKPSPLERAVRDLLHDDLELSQAEVGVRLRGQGLGSLPDDQLQDLFISQRRIALRQRVHETIGAGVTTPAALSAKLFPHLDPNLNDPKLRLLQEVYAKESSARAMRRFAIAETPAQALQSGVQPLAVDLNLAPLPIFSEVATSGGFVNYDFFREPTVRFVPLVAQCDGKIYPQMGLALGCLMIGADLDHATVEPSELRIPMLSKKGTGADVLRIPVRDYYASKLSKRMQMIADIPWVGTSDWRTMFSTPHQPITKLWDIVSTQDKIAQNDRSIDLAAQQVLSDQAVGGRPGLGLDPPKAQALARRKLNDADAAGHDAVAADVLKVIADTGYEDAWRKTPPAAADRGYYEEFMGDKQVLTEALRQNKLLAEQINKFRSDLAALVGGKCVMIGMVATGDVDQVTTPLHSRCPGVVVHAAIVNAVLQGNWTRTAPYWVTIIVVLAAGGLTAGAGARLEPHWALLGAIGLIAAFLAIAGYVLFDLFRVRIGLAGPVVEIGIVWIGCATVRLLIEGYERLRIGREKAATDHEMDLARRVQQELLPKFPPKIAGIECCGWTLAASVTGGDCFDLWQLPDGRLGVLVADASGHGLAPSMIVSQVRTLVRVLCESERDPAKILDRVNARLAEDLEAGRFVTAFLAFCLPDGPVDWASAGHGPMLWRAGDAGALRELDTTCLPLGVTADLPPEDAAHLMLEAGGLLIIFSDGIFESPNSKNELYGVERLTALLQALSDQPGEKIIERIQDEMRQWQGKTEPHDDQTTVIIRRTGIISSNGDGSSEDGASKAGEPDDTLLTD